MSSQFLKVKLFDPVCKPFTSKVGDWVDLAIRETVTLKAGEYKQLPLGVCIKLPEGFEALVIPRSSTFKRHGILLANSVGLIDEAYCGNTDEWCFPAYATKDATILKGTRICQFRIIKHQPQLIFRYVNEMTDGNRGGLGSTGY